MASTNVTGLFLMWSVMMVAMMMVLFYARVGRKAAIDAEPFTPTGLFAVGYLLVWFGFALAATGAHSALERGALLTTSMGGTSNVVGGSLLVMAGLYQWSPLKDTCLAHCQAPLHFIQGHGFRRKVLGAMTMQNFVSSTRPSPDAPIHSTPKQPLGPGTGMTSPSGIRFARAVRTLSSSATSYQKR